MGTSASEFQGFYDWKGKYGDVGVNNLSGLEILKDASVIIFSRKWRTKRVISPHLRKSHNLS